MKNQPQKFKETEIGPIPEEWGVLKLDQVTSFISRGVTPSYTEKEDVVVLNQKCVRDGKISFEESRFTDPKTKPISKTKYLEQFDILINSTGQGTLGRVAQVKNLEKTTTADSHLTIVRPDDTKIDPLFLGYFLRKIQPLIESFAEGSTGQTELSREKVKDIDIPVPSTVEQAMIGIILSCLDDKIELNHQINANLEKMASALFKRWFVDFEFPDENGKPYKSSGGKMVESELGEIPEGWRVGKLDEISDITIGRTPPRMEERWFSTDPKDKKWISIRDMGNCGMYINQTAEYLTQEAIERFNIPVIPSNTVVVSFKLTVGRIAITADEMLSNEAIAHIKLIDPTVTTEYVYCALKKFDFASLASTSSIATAVNSKSIKEIPILIPSNQSVTGFTKVVGPIFSDILCRAHQIEMTSRIRDTLLPKLMTGKIRLSV